MSKLTGEQFEDIVLESSPKMYLKFCKTELPIYLGLSILNTLLIMFSHTLDPTVFATITIGSLISFLIHGVYIFRFRSQVIVPFRLTYNLPRKLVSSWTLGAGYAAVFFILHQLQVIPFFGSLVPLGGAALIGFNTVVAYRYHRWQFKRQNADKSLHPVEWFFVALVAAMFGGSIITFATMLFMLGMVIQCAIEADCSVIDMLLAPILWLLEVIGLSDPQAS